MSSPFAIASTLAPSFTMVRRYFIAGLLAFVTFSIMMLAESGNLHGHHFQPSLLAITHVATLGWVTMVIFGAMYQLIPVVLEVKLFSERIAVLQFWIYCAGVIGLVTGFWSFSVGLHLTASATLATLAILLFIGNILMTMTRVSKWNLTGLYVLAALFYLAVTAIAGLLLSINLGYPFISRIHLDYLKIHAHVGFVGWVTMVIMGVGLKLIPMFSLSHGYSTVPAKAAYVLVNLGLLGTSIEWLLTGVSWVLSVYIMIMALGIFCFFIQLVLVFRHRMKRIMDLGMRHSAVAFVYGGVATIAGLVLAFGGISKSEPLVLAYGSVIILGFFTMLIVGQMYKIVPFLVWFHTFSDKVGKEPVPMLKEMVNERIGNFQFWILNAAILFVTVGLGGSLRNFLTAGLVFLVIASALAGYNILSVFLLQVKHGNDI